MEENKEAVQELYRELDSLAGGTRNLAWYGQLRALGYTHEEAIVLTKKKYIEKER